MDADKKKIATIWWKKGAEAMNQQNWDYAIESFHQAATLVPDNVTYRQSLRGCERKKYNDNKTGARFAGTRLMGVRGKIKKARMQKNWKAVAETAEEGLKVNPWDPQLNADLGEACQHLGYSEVAVFAFTTAVENDQQNADYNRSLALLLEERGNYKEAISCWERIYKADPLDSQARSKITQLQAETVMERGGYVEAKSTQDVKTAYDQFRPTAGRTPEAAEGPGMSVEADLQRAIRKEPANVQNYLKLADYYKREKQLDEAAETYRKALEVSGGDPNVREQLEDIELDQLRHNLALAKEAAGDGDQTARQNAAALADELLRREIEVLSSRAERYPADMRVKYELARRFMRARKWQLAIPLLQKASADSRMKADVLVSLGKCFVQDNKRDLARRQFEKAVEVIESHDRPELFCETHYLAGVLCEDAGQREQAETHYSEVLAVNYDYKDARQRLERLQGGAEGT